MNKRGRKSRLFLCFRPISFDDDLRPTKKLKLPTDSSVEEDTNVSGAGITKEKHSHRFSGALKSVMSDLFMTKRLGSKRFRSISLRLPSTKNSSTPQNNKISKTMSDTISFRRSLDTDDVFKSNSSRSSSTATTTNGGYSSLVSSTASSFSSNSYSVLRRNRSSEANLNESKQVQQKKNVRSSEFLNTNIGLSLIVLSLLVLIVWGKICAILCTSTWLLLMSARFKEDSVVKKSSKWDDHLRGEDVDSGKYKKRVIMEGLLDRNRSSRRL